MKLSLFLFSLLSFLAWGAVRIGSAISFDRHCGGYLARAANANTVELAARELGRGVAYMEANELTQGFTSVVYRTPDEDVGYWHENLKTALAELQAIKPAATPLERSNVLMKLRETLTYHGKEGTRLEVPDGISVYPNNGLLFAWGWLSFLVLIATGVAVVND